LQLNYLDSRELINNCISNDSGAKKKLYNLFASKMLSICYRYANSKDDAEDIFQEGFLRVFENLHQVKNAESLEWWMKKIFINEAMKLYNKNKRISLYDDLSSVRTNKANEYGVLDKLGSDEIVRIIQMLPDKMRIVFNMYVIEGFSHKEIGEMLNISEGTSKSNLHDARKILQRKIFSLKKIKLWG
jgi:RNA polymerase sigma-70 factor (ECF subfamily)